ncbi:hypothetical protein LR48_Vigan845s004900 [Vigna angularis]|uniref:Uncharacterized protein n=1 Tax=Phaseolus angularis TaxID=3914 RepID=A0A0L9THT4_PHAAN|nr:hypothetical protein LR48_Vigan845s004900 [Vigna angularis]
MFHFPHSRSTVSLFPHPILPLLQPFPSPLPSPSTPPFPHHPLLPPHPPKRPRLLGFWLSEVEAVAGPRDVPQDGAHGHEEERTRDGAARARDGAMREPATVRHESNDGTAMAAAMTERRGCGDGVVVCFSKASDCLLCQGIEPPPPLFHLHSRLLRIVGTIGIVIESRSGIKYLESVLRSQIKFNADSVLMAVRSSALTLEIPPDISLPKAIIALSGDTQVCVGSMREGKAFALRMRWRLREKMDSQLGYLNWDSWFLCLGFCVELVAVDGSLRLRVRNGVVRDPSSSSAADNSLRLCGIDGVGGGGTVAARCQKRWTLLR